MDMLPGNRAALCCAGQAPQRSKRLVEAAVAALRSRDAAKQQKAIDAILRDAHARVPRVHWAAEWTAAQALPVRSRHRTRASHSRNKYVVTPMESSNWGSHN